MATRKEQACLDIVDLRSVKLTLECGSGAGEHFCICGIVRIAKGTRDCEDVVQNGDKRRRLLDDDAVKSDLRNRPLCVRVIFVDGLPIMKKRRHDARRKGSTVKRKMDLEHSCLY